MFRLGKESKRSSEIALMIIHKMLLDPCYDHREETLDEFQDFDAQMDIYRQMSLDKHFMNHVKKRSMFRPTNANADLRPNFALEVILVLKSLRPTLPMSSILAKLKHEEAIQKEVDANQAAMKNRLGRNDQDSNFQTSQSESYGTLGSDEDYEYDIEHDVGEQIQGSS